MIGIACLAAAVLCLLYCVVTARTGSGGRFYLVWLAGGVFFLLLAGLLRTGLWDGIPVWVRRVFFGMIIAGVILFISVEGLVLSGFGQKGRAGLDYIIVLGAQVREDGPSRALQFRLDAACAYLQANPDTVCILSGGQGDNEPVSEAEGMYRYLTAAGIAPDRLVREDRSRDTAENIANSMALIGSTDAAVGIVTNNFHVFRGVRLAKAAGLQDVCGIAAGFTPLYLPHNMMREFFGVLKDFFCGNLTVS